jgi:hypothetical protein
MTHKAEGGRAMKTRTPYPRVFHWTTFGGPAARLRAYKARAEWVNDRGHVAPRTWRDEARSTGSWSPRTPWTYTTRPESKREKPERRWAFEDVDHAGEYLRDVQYADEVSSWITAGGSAMIRTSVKSTGASSRVARVAVGSLGTRTARADRRPRSSILGTPTRTSATRRVLLMRWRALTLSGPGSGASASGGKNACESSAPKWRRSRPITMRRSVHPKA